MNDRFRIINYRKGEIISWPNQPCKQIGFILDGVARSYLLKMDGKDITWFFHYYSKNATAKQVMLIDYPSFALQQPSVYGFQALTECCIVTLSFGDTQEFLLKFSVARNLERQLVISAYGHNNKRLYALLAKSSQVNLGEFNNEHGFLFEKIPHYYIASYLVPDRKSNS